MLNEEPFIEFVMKQAEKNVKGGQTMSKAQELYELHKKINVSKYIMPESENLYLKYVELTEVEEQELIDLLIQENGTIDDDENTLSTILYHIAIFTKGNSLCKIYEALIKNKLFYPAEIYLKAGESEAKLLIQELENTDEDYLVQINHILMCLAYIPCDLVKNYLINASGNNKPFWAKKLHILPIEYSKCGGWTIDRKSKIKLLYNDKITAFIRTSISSSPKAPLEKNTVVCPFCNNNLYTIFKDDFEIATCLFCSCYQNIFIKVGDNGKAFWHERNSKSDLLEKILCRGTELAPPDYKLEQTDEKRLPSFTLNQFVSISKTQIGGMPTNINDPTYPSCPECGETMTFIAQLDMEDVDEYGEGIYYFFYCNDCKVVSSSYGQT